MEIVRVLRGMPRTGDPSPGTSGAVAVEPRLEIDRSTSTSKYRDNVIENCILTQFVIGHRVRGLGVPCRL